MRPIAANSSPSDQCAISAGEVGEHRSVGVQGTGGERGRQQLAGTRVLGLVEQKQGVLPHHVEQARVALTCVVGGDVAGEDLPDVLGIRQRDHGDHRPVRSVGHANGEDVAVLLVQPAHDGWPEAHQQDRLDRVRQA
jgi:hypothetical protein